MKASVGRKRVANATRTELLNRGTGKNSWRTHTFVTKSLQESNEGLITCPRHEGLDYASMALASKPTGDKPIAPRLSKRLHFFGSDSDTSAPVTRAELCLPCLRALDETDDCHNDNAAHTRSDDISNYTAARVRAQQRTQ